MVAAMSESLPGLDSQEGKEGEKEEMVERRKGEKEWGREAQLSFTELIHKENPK